MSESLTKRIALAAILLVMSAEALLSSQFAQQVQAATFKLFHKSSTATCWFVRPKDESEYFYLVTAAHVLERINQDHAIIVLRKPQEDGAFLRHDHTIQIRDQGTALWTQHESQDVAVLRLTNDLPVAVDALPVSTIASTTQLSAAGVHVCSPLFMFTFPQRLEANAAAFPIARQGIFASPPLLPAQSFPVFKADFTTSAGDSGGPVFIDKGDEPLIVGITVSQFRHDEKIETEYEERKIHHPMGIGGVLHAEYIRHTLKAAAKDTSPAVAQQIKESEAQSEE